jgi:hypothetical protein
MAGVAEADKGARAAAPPTAVFRKTRLECAMGAPFVRVRFFGPVTVVADAAPTVKLKQMDQS